jgi:mannose/fructose/N-acetylgalactosamine-specific phosphotransferase system component IID
MAIEIISKEPLTLKERRSLWNRYMWFYNGCTNFQNFYGNGWAWTLRPLFEKYYNKEGQIDSMKNHLDWYNNEGQTAALLSGIIVGMEEERALKGTVSQEVIRATKATMQGPIAGIGDSLVQGTLIPLLLGIAINLTESSGAVGPLFYILTYLVIIVFGSYFLFNKGYSMGRSALSAITGPNIGKFIESIMLFGTIVVGALGANYVKATTAIKWSTGVINEKTGEEIAMQLQTIIDGIFPKLLSLLVILGCFYFVKKMNISMPIMIIALLVIVVIGTAVGIF